MVNESTKEVESTTQDTAIRRKQHIPGMYIYILKVVLNAHSTAIWCVLFHRAEIIFLSFDYIISLQKGYILYFQRVSTHKEKTMRETHMK